MAKGNGKAHMEGQHALPMAPSEFTIFRIGGQDIQVPALTLDMIERAKGSLLVLSPDLSWVDYASNVCDIVAAAVQEMRPELTADILVKACSMGEALALTATFNELLRVSGFIAPGEQTAALETSPGTSTQMLLPPNSPPKESAPGTSAG